MAEKITEHDLARCIRDLRRRAGLTQEQLGAALQITEQSVSKWERGISQT